MRRWFLLPLFFCTACSLDDELSPEATEATAAPSQRSPEPCPHAEPGPVPPELELDPFYEKYVDAAGLPIVGSAKVSDAAFRVALFIVEKMTEARSDLADELVANGVRIGILATTEVTTDLPEYRDLYAAFPMIDWDRRARGLGATLERPLSSVGEENLLQLAHDPYRGESIMVHELSHTLFDLGVRFTPAGDSLERRLEAAYDSAVAAGLWRGTYAETQAKEYWAEGVQSFFDANLEAVPPDGIHNHVDTRRDLFDYDPELANLIADVFGDVGGAPKCAL